MAYLFGPNPAKVLDWHDGDTAFVDVDLGWGMRLNAYDINGKVQLTCRIFGMNAPELEVGGQPNQPGLDALAYARQICPPGTLVKATSHSWDKYGGRWDGTLTLPDSTDYATLMIQSGHAVVMK